MVSKRGVGYRRASPEEAPQLLADARTRTRKTTRRTVAKAVTLSSGATLSEADQQRLYVEMASASGVLAATDPATRNRITERVHQQGRELVSADVIDAMKGG